MYGAEVVILNLSKGLERAGHESILGVFTHSGQTENQLLEASVAEGIATHSIPCNGRVDISSIQMIRKLSREAKADVVHAHGYKADIYTGTAMLGSNIPIVSTCHNWIDSDFATKVYGYADRLALHQFSAIAAVSSNVQDRLHSAGISKTRVIGNGVDPERFSIRAMRSSRPVSFPLTIGLAGRLSQEKDVELFLQTAAAVLPEFPSAQFVIAGEGPEREMLETLIDKLQIRSSVTLMGRCNDMPRFYGSLDVLVSSSRTEGFPMGLLEGMASYLPIVATNVGDVAKIVRHGESGFLVPAGNPGMLKDALSRLLSDGALRLSFGEKGREIVSREFSIEAMTQNYLRMYEHAILGNAATSK